MAVVFPPVSGGSASQASVSAIQVDIGDPSVSSTNLYDSLKYLYQKTAGASLASVVQDSILSHILASSGTVANFDDTTDSLEAISNKIVATQSSLSDLQIDVGDPSVASTNLFDSLKYLYQQTAGASMASVIQDSILSHILASNGTVANFDDTLHSLEALYKALSGQVNAVDRIAGKYQIFEKSITSNANAGTTTVATITTQPCWIEGIVLHSDSASQASLTSAAIQGGANGVVTFINSTSAAAANIDTIDEQVSWTGAVRLAATKTIIMDLIGTGATAVDLTVIVGYRACADGGYLS